MIVRVLGYVGFFAASFVVSTYLTFPWDTVKERALQAASKTLGRRITASSLSPSWLTGVEATEVEVEMGPDAEPLAFDTFFARAHVFDFVTGGYGGRVSAPLGGGEIEGSVSGSEKRLAVDAEIRELRLALVPALRAASGLALSGTVQLEADLDLGLEDPKTSSGGIHLVAQGLETLDGSDAAFPVPALVLGDLDWDLPVEDGKLIIRNQRLDGPSLSLVVDGEIVLSNPLSRSLVNLTLKFKPTPQLREAEPTIGLLLNNLNRYKAPDGFYGYQMSGTVKRPRFTPRRPS